MANPFKKRITFASATAPLVKVVADLKALQEQNAVEVGLNSTTIADLTQKNVALTAEAQQAGAVATNFANLLKTS